MIERPALSRTYRSFQGSGWSTTPITCYLRCFNMVAWGGHHTLNVCLRLLPSLRTLRTVCQIKLVFHCYDKLSERSGLRKVRFISSYSFRGYSPRMAVSWQKGQGSGSLSVHEAGVSAVPVWCWKIFGELLLLSPHEKNEEAGCCCQGRMTVELSIVFVEGL